jgi:nucleotide-binding universal stress UspA family protein
LVFKKILVPYDGSEYSENAIHLAIDIAKAFEGSQVILLHVIPEIPVSPLYLGTIRSKKNGESLTLTAYLKEAYQEMKNNMTSKLQAKIKTYADTGIAMDTKILIGSPSGKILEFVKDESVDLVVMGRAGLTGGIGRFMKAIGSVSRTVSENHHVL